MFWTFDFVNVIYNAFERGDFLMSALCDLSNAFDPPLKKPEKYNFSPNSTAIIKSYL